MSFCNHYFLASENMAYTSKEYMTHVNRYQEILKGIQDGSQQKIGPLVVLDVFSGIGSLPLILKRLSLHVKTIISVEHDRVASYVADRNHIDSNDGIQYITKYNTFQKLIENIDEVWNNYGSVHLIAGGPPCNDFTQVNAYRQGTRGASGKYLVEFGNFITNIQQRNKDVFFLSENVVFANELHEVSAAYGNVPPVQLDAKDFSGNKRNRQYWLNLPVGAVDIDNVACESSPLFTGNYELPAKALNPSLPAKANTIMGSKSRQDDERNWKVKLVNDNKGSKMYEVQTFSVVDRECMMGFPVGYVSTAVESLFKNLKENAFNVEVAGHKKKHWYDSLEKQLHPFNQCNFRFKPHRDNFYEVRIESENSTSCFDSEEYAKHLLGNAWSIPVVERLLSPLKAICEAKQYDGYDYPFCWPPFTLSLNDE